MVTGATPGSVEPSDFLMLIDGDKEFTSNVAGPVGVTSGVNQNHVGVLCAALQFIEQAKAVVPVEVRLQTLIDSDWLKVTTAGEIPNVQTIAGPGVQLGTIPVPGSIVKLVALPTNCAFGGVPSNIGIPFVWCWKSTTLDEPVRTLNPPAKKEIAAKIPIAIGFISSLPTFVFFVRSECVQHRMRFAVRKHPSFASSSNS